MQPSNPPTPASEARESPFHVPPVTLWLIVLNVLAQGARSLLTPSIDDGLIRMFGFDAAGSARGMTGMTAITLVTYQFLHAGWEHLGVNMLGLLAFGPGIESLLGRGRYIALYLLSGVAGALVEALFTAPSTGDTLIGASASISGVFGALMVMRGLYRLGPRPLGLIPMTLLWIGLLALTGVLGAGGGGAPIAWIAHIGGFLSGIFFAFLFRQRIPPV